MSQKIPWSKLDYYVYAYVDPRDDSVFYIGKGKGRRAEAHLKDQKESEKVKRIAEIRAGKNQPHIEIVQYGLATSEEAERIEAACIDVVGIHNLTNNVRGKGSRVYGRRSLVEIAGKLSSVHAKVVEPAIAILINQRFAYGMSPLELYESTRGVWAKNSMPKGYGNAQYALSVADHQIHEIYEIAGWHPAASTQYFTREVQSSERIEFVGRVASAAVRKKYVGKILQERGFGSPILGFNLERG